MGTWLAVALGGALGSMARYGAMVSVGQMSGTGFPYGTLTVNVAGGFVMGFLVELMALVWSPSEMTRVFLTVGILGGFTTFSTFSLDAWLLIEKGAYGPAAVYMIASVLLSVGALAAGLILGRAILA